MAWLNAQGNPVQTMPITIQIDVPCEACVSQGDALKAMAPNWGAIMAAVIQLVIAMMTGNSAAIAAAIQALIRAFMG